MNNDKDKKEKTNKDAAVKPDPETLNTTDPQDEMEGPISSLVNDATEDAEKDDEKPKKKND